MPEWLLQEAVQLRVRGYEVNRSWWEGANSIPHFIDIQYCDELEDRSCPLPSNSALMFCYFNNLEYFHRYLDQYKGSVLSLGESSKMSHLKAREVLVSKIV